MKIIVDISDDMYKHIKNSEFYSNTPDSIAARSIKYGVPIPKGHGKILDANQLYEDFYKYTRDTDLDFRDCQAVINYARGIIDEDDTNAYL